MATETTEQIVREAPEIEAYKLGLLQSAKALPAPVLPGYQVAGMSPEQISAIQSGMGGIGAYRPYLQAGQENLGQGAATTAEAANILRGADTRGQFAAAQESYNLAAQPAAAVGALSNVAGAGMGLLGQGAADINYAQQMAQQAQQANLAPSQAMMMQSAVNAQMAGPQFGQAAGVIGQGIGSLQGAAQGYDPQSAQAFMNPYQQQVIDATMAQMDRQAKIAQQGVSAQAVRSGAFGGSREGIQRAEMERNLLDQKTSAVANLMSQGYSQSQAQSLQAFEQQQQRQMGQGQALQGAGAQLGSLESQRAQQALQAAQYTGGVGQNIGAQNLQQAGLGQSAASLYGQLGTSEAGLAGQYANIAGQQANILGQQSQLQQQIGQGIGGLATQQFGVGSQMAQGLGSLGGQLGNLGVQQGALGQTAQGLGQQDVNFQYNLGSQIQRQTQAELDAQRATSMQTALQPQQQIAFLSDIYKGAPSTQMSAMTQNQAAPSPFQQVAGLATGALATAGAAKTAGLF